MMFPLDTKYLYRVSAANNVGYSEVSTTLEIVTDTYPSGMTAVKNGTVTPLSIVLTWPAFTDYTLTGRDPITFYQVEYD